ncbi:hypothetical protein A9Q87_12830 [Flavobacteriales bacterium 34_180_T64]|nr:hypothetical protein A9Q87_12830 [Flavobacteriales bacterium 34_180_T64]
MKKITFLSILLITFLGYGQQQIYNLGFEPGSADATAGNWTTFENPSPGLSIVTNSILNGTNTSGTTQVLRLTMAQGSACYAGAINFHGALGTWELDGAVTSNLTLSMDVNRSAGSGANVGIKFANATDGTIFQITGSEGAVSADGVWETLTWDISAGAASGDNVNIDQMVVFIDFTCDGGTRTGDVELLVDNISWGANKLTDPPAPTCSDGIENGNETGVDCGGPDCDACIEDPTEGPGNNGSTGADFYIYSELSGNPNSSDFTGFNLIAFSGGGMVFSEPDLNGDTVLKAENINFFGSGFGENFNATGTYTYVHLNYYATTSTGFNFSLIDNSLSATICCGNPEEPFYRFGAGQDAPIVLGQWVSVFIPLSHYANHPDLVSGTWDGVDLKETLFTGNGTVYIDNIFFSTTNSLGINEFNVAEFKVYPNPTQNVWNVKANSIISKIHVYDVLGKSVMVLNPMSNEAQIDASSLPKGLYFANLESAKGTQSIKLIKN